MWWKAITCSVNQESNERPRKTRNFFCNCSFSWFLPVGEVSFSINNIKFWQVRISVWFKWNVVEYCLFSAWKLPVGYPLVLIPQRVGNNNYNSVERLLLSKCFPSSNINNSIFGTYPDLLSKSIWTVSLEILFECISRQWLLNRVVCSTLSSSWIE